MSEGLIVMARPSAQVRHEIATRLQALALPGAAARAMVAPSNWHQSLSAKHPMAYRDALIRACERLVGSSASLVFDRITSGKQPKGGIHWTLRGPSATTPAFADLLDALQRRLLAARVPDRMGHTAHITLNYFGDHTLGDGKPMPLAPIVWTIDRIELVVAGGTPYGYQTLMQWPLASPRQSALF